MDGSDTMVFGRLGDTEIVARTAPEAVGDIGAKMRLYANMNHMHLFDPETEKAI
ncbi:MAG: hypothetical protein ACE5Q3_17130 [Alphaproteobacteria bacterium]